MIAWVVGCTWVRIIGGSSGLIRKSLLRTRPRGKWLVIRTLKPGKRALGSDVMAIWNYLETQKSAIFILVSGLSVVLRVCSGVSLRGIHPWY